ncbi:hypothetical protein ACFWAY_49165 [Rhodococcus sp. NPDC059968]
MTESPPVDRAAIAADLERARVALHELVDGIWRDTVFLERRSTAAG